jgi:hypothetical protein
MVGHNTQRLSSHPLWEGDRPTAVGPTLACTVRRSRTIFHDANKSALLNTAEAVGARMVLTAVHMLLPSPSQPDMIRRWR